MHREDEKIEHKSEDELKDHKSEGELKEHKSKEGLKKFSMPSFLLRNEKEDQELDEVEHDSNKDQKELEDENEAWNESRYPKPVQ